MRPPRAFHAKEKKGGERRARGGEEERETRSLATRCISRRQRRLITPLVSRRLQLRPPVYLLAPRLKMYRRPRHYGRASVSQDQGLCA